MLNGNRLVSSFKTLVIAAGVMTAIGATSGTASAAPVLPDFTLNTTVFGGPNAALVADKFTGNYNEVLTVTGANTFSTVAYWDAGQIVHNDGTVPYAAGQTGMGVTYSIYALFSANGTFTPNGTGGFDFSAGTGSISLWLDDNLDTGKTLPGAAPGPVALSGNGDDKLLASAALLTGSGHENATDPLASGDFGLLFQPFNLTALGSTYFIAPQPFYLEAILKGQFNSFVPVGNQLINGSSDAFFADVAVPEPATLTLLGLGLAGIARRRRATKA